MTILIWRLGDKATDLLPIVTEYLSDLVYLFVLDKASLMALLV